MAVSLEGLEEFGPPSRFSEEDIRLSVEEAFTNVVPPDARGGVVAVATREGVKVAFAQRIHEHWQVVVQGNVDYKGRMSGQVKVLGHW